MTNRRIARAVLVGILPVFLASCGNSNGLFASIGNLSNRIFGGADVSTGENFVPPANATAGAPPPIRVLPAPERSGLIGLVNRGDDSSTRVNAYIWAAALDVLGFLPVEAANPATGMIRTGFGTAPGGTRAYRADVHVDGAALDATTLQLSLYTRSGLAPAATTQALADAILDRARQLRLASR